MVRLVASLHVGSFILTSSLPSLSYLGSQQTRSRRSLRSTLFARRSLRMDHHTVRWTHIDSGCRSGDLTLSICTSNRAETIRFEGQGSCIPKDTMIMSAFYTCVSTALTILVILHHTDIVCGASSRLSFSTSLRAVWLYGNHAWSRSSTTPPESHPQSWTISSGYASASS